MTTQAEKVRLLIDGRQVEVPKGTNLIEAARTVGIEIPHYCWHKHLSVAGNCRICQVKVKGAPKLDIACNTQVKEGMEVSTHLTSKEVADAQAAVLEFILINHPLDCTVCDQSGHCKLQDYHFTYNAKESRFLEEKEHKVKAVPLGPTVMLDGERCIMCTRCIRFCDEVTKTHELGMLNRGDRSVISTAPGKELNNPLSGTVVDLCPVGALTHRMWRFNTRIWFTSSSKTICPGCSTGCNCKVFARDGQIVHVKACQNDAVNKEWMCDEGRYGFMRFLPDQRLSKALVGDRETAFQTAIEGAARIKGRKAVVFAAANLSLEEYYLLKDFIQKVVPGAKVVVNCGPRTLTETEKILISPDYAPNFMGAVFSGLVSGDLQKQYEEALKEVRSNQAGCVLIAGQQAVKPEDIDPAFLEGLKKSELSIGILTDAKSPLISSLRVTLPGRSVLEKSGLMISSNKRLQAFNPPLAAMYGSETEWLCLVKIARAAGFSDCCIFNGVSPQNERELMLAILSTEKRLAGISPFQIGQGGVKLDF